MGKNLWLAVICILGVFLLIIAFENIFIVQTLGILFIQQDVSSFLVILSSAAAGFLMGFSFMMYSHEIRKEQELFEQEDSIPAQSSEPVKPKKSEATIQTDTFDDEEVLG